MPNQNNSMNFPNPCSHCGACCLITQCPVSKLVHGELPKGKTCPSLSFNGDKSSCELVARLGPETLGSGVGCCISAQVVVNGEAYDFASLTEHLKIMATRQIRRAPQTVLNARTLQPV